MCLESEVSKDGSSILVTIPPTRHDVIHPCDIYEVKSLYYSPNYVLISHQNVRL